MEYIPIDGGKKFVALVNDVMKIVDRSGTRIYLWIDTIAVDVTNEVRGSMLELGSARFDLSSIFDDKPWLYAYTIDSVENYVAWLKNFVDNALKGSKVLAAFSGGKDSTTVLLVLRELAKYIDFEFYALYVHMPYIEPLENPRFAKEVADRLGIELVVVEPPRKEVLKELMCSGLPRRGARLCTYIKVVPMRFYTKSRLVNYVAYGDRVWEAGKRFQRLFCRTLYAKIFASKRMGFTPIAPLTLLDVVKACRDHGLVHPMYLRGVQRVACSYCPYKPVYEFYVVEKKLEDPGIVEDAMKSGWKRYYRDRGIPWEDYERFHLWRFSPTLAKALLEAKYMVEKLAKDRDTIDAKNFVRSLASLWIENIDAPRIDIENIVRALKRLCEERRSGEALHHPSGWD